MKSRTVSRAVPAEIVRSASMLAVSNLERDFCEAACELAGNGVWAITSSCGFLVRIQARLQAVVPDVPVRTSSLLQLPMLLAETPRIGVLTISSESLDVGHLLAAGVATERLQDVLIQGVDPASEFVRQILDNQADINFSKAAADVVGAALELKRKAPDLKHLVLECTNMPPYQAEIARVTGLTCWSLRDDPILKQLARLNGYPYLTHSLN